MSVATEQVLLFTACVYIEIVFKFVSEVMDFFQSEKGGRKLVRDGYHKNTTLGMAVHTGGRRLYVPQKHNAGKR